MKLKKKQLEMVSNLVDWWESSGLLERGQGGILKETLEHKSFEWKKVPEYLMGLAVLCLVVAFFHLVADEWLLGLIEQLFALSDLALMTFLFVLALSFYGLAYWMYRKNRRNALSRNTLLVLGSMAFGGALVYFGRTVKENEALTVSLVLIFAVQSFASSRLFRSGMLCDFGWLALFLWLGLESSRQTQWEGLWFGMNLPIRFVVFSLMPVLVALGFNEERRYHFMALSAKRSGWLFFWGSLWLVSLFGNHTSWTGWENASALSLLPWGGAVGAIGFLFWYIGRLRADLLFKWMGMAAMTAVGYTQFFLFLWEPLHPTLFFALLGVSFLCLGRKAEMLRRR